MVFNILMAKKDDNVDPAKAAFLAALEAKKSKSSGSGSQVAGPDKSNAHKSGPDAARRMFQRRSGNS